MKKYYMAYIYFYILDAKFKAGSVITPNWPVSLARLKEKLDAAVIVVTFLRELEPLETRQLDEFRKAGVEVEQ